MLQDFTILQKQRIKGKICAGMIMSGQFQVSFFSKNISTKRGTEGLAGSDTLQAPIEPNPSSARLCFPYKGRGDQDV